MKKLLTFTSVLSLSFGWGPAVQAQGTIVFNNRGPSDGRVYLVPPLSGPGSGGVPILLNEDLNFELLAGRSGGPLTVVHTWLLSDGTAKGINVGPGLFADPSGGVYAVPGVAPGGNVVVEVVAWGGNVNTFGEATLAHYPIGIGPGFGMTAGSAAAPPASLVGMPTLNVTIPEPQTSHLLPAGLIALGLLRRRPTRLKA